MGVCECDSKNEKMNKEIKVETPNSLNKKTSDEKNLKNDNYHSLYDFSGCKNNDKESFCSNYHEERAKQHCSHCDKSLNSYEIEHYYGECYNCRFWDTSS